MHQIIDEQKEQISELKRLLRASKAETEKAAVTISNPEDTVAALVRQMLATASRKK